MQTILVPVLPLQVSTLVSSLDSSYCIALTPRLLLVLLSLVSLYRATLIQPRTLDYRNLGSKDLGMPVVL